MPDYDEWLQKMSYETSSLKAAQEHIIQLEKELKEIETIVKERVDFLYKDIKKFKENTLGDTIWSFILFFRSI